MVTTELLKKNPCKKKKKPSAKGQKQYIKKAGKKEGKKERRKEGRRVSNFGNEARNGCRQRVRRPTEIVSEWRLALGASSVVQVQIYWQARLQANNNNEPTDGAVLCCAVGKGR